MDAERGDLFLRPPANLIAFFFNFDNRGGKDRNDNAAQSHSTRRALNQLSPIWPQIVGPVRLCKMLQTACGKLGAFFKFIDNDIFSIDGKSIFPLLTLLSYELSLEIELDEDLQKVTLLE